MTKEYRDSLIAKLGATLRKSILDGARDSQGNLLRGQNAKYIDFLNNLASMFMLAGINDESNPDPEGSEAAIEMTVHVAAIRDELRTLNADNPK